MYDEFSEWTTPRSKLPTSQMKSLFLWDLQHDDSFTLDDQRLNEIEHLAGLSFPNELKVKKNKLKFAHGHFIDHYVCILLLNQHAKSIICYKKLYAYYSGIEKVLR